MITKIPLLIGEKSTEELRKIDMLPQIDNFQYVVIQKTKKKNTQDIPNTYSKNDIKIFCNIVLYCRK
jgi:hypothetical protein